jgi:hypothetical protein
VKGRVQALRATKIIGAEGNRKGVGRKTAKKQKIPEKRNLKSESHTKMESTEQDYASEHRKSYRSDPEHILRQGGGSNTVYLDLRSHTDPNSRVCIGKRGIQGLTGRVHGVVRGSGGPRCLY